MKDDMVATITKALRLSGATVLPLCGLGDNLPHLLVGRDGNNYLLTVLQDGQTLEPSKSRWLHWWHGHIELVTSVADALSAVEITYEKWLEGETQ
jgi:hypothetical protein